MSGSDGNRILFVTLSNIGDLVMTTPVLRAINELYPQHTIDVVADRRSGELLRPCPFVGDLIWKDKQLTWGQRLKFIRRIRERKYTLAVDLRGPWLAWLARASKVGIKNKRDETMHAVEHHFTALSGLGREGCIPAAKLWLSEAAKDAAQKILDLKHSKPILAIAPGANWPGKIWPRQAYAKLIRLLADDYAEVYIFGGPDDSLLATDISKDSPLITTNLCGRTSLIETAACLSKASVFIGNDSGVGHIAAALKIPTVTVFGEGDPDRYRPWGANSAVVLAPQKNLHKLSAEVVAEAVKSHFNNRVKP